MSNKNSGKIEKIRIFWEKYEKRVVLAIGIILVAVVSFGVGILQGHKIEQKTLVIEKAPELSLGTNPLQSGVLGVAVDKNEEATKTKASEGSGVVATGECAFVGSKNSDKYHLPSCRWAKNIKPENLVCFKNEEEAKSKGYVGDKTCVK